MMANIYCQQLPCDEARRDNGTRGHRPQRVEFHVLRPKSYSHVHELSLQKFAVSTLQGIKYKITNCPDLTIR